MAGVTRRGHVRTSWYVDAPARARRLDNVRLTFEKMHIYANHLGLYCAYAQAKS